MRDINKGKVKKSYVLTGDEVAHYFVCMRRLRLLNEEKGEADMAKIYGQEEDDMWKMLNESGYFKRI